MYAKIYIIKNYSISCDIIKQKWKNLAIALIIAVIVTSIGAVLSYYTTLKPITEMSEDMEIVDSSSNTLGSILYDTSHIEEAMYQKALVEISGYLIVVFCITTVISYFVVERLNKNKKS